MTDSHRARMLAGLPLSERRLTLGGAATAVLEGGDGPPLILLHGGIECGGAYWAPLIPDLVERHRLVVPDVPGLGESEPAERLDLPAFASWLADLVGATGLERPALVAHSLLSSLAVRLAARQEELLGRLFLYGAPGVGRYRLPLGLRVVAIRFGLRPSEQNAERFNRWAFFDLERVCARDPGWFEAFNAYSRARARTPHVKRTMRSLISSCVKRVPDAELRRVATPTTLLWGRHDRFVPVEVGEEAAARHGWPLRVIEDAGHVPHVERPRAFLQSLSEEPIRSVL